MMGPTLDLGSDPGRLTVALNRQSRVDRYGRTAATGRPA